MMTTSSNVLLLFLLQSHASVVLVCGFAVQVPASLSLMNFKQLTNGVLYITNNYLENISSSGGVNDKYDSLALSSTYGTERVVPIDETSSTSTDESGNTFLIDDVLLGENSRVKHLENALEERLAMLAQMEIELDERVANLAKAEEALDRNDFDQALKMLQVLPFPFSR